MASADDGNDAIIVAQEVLVDTNSNGSDAVMNGDFNEASTSSLEGAEVEISSIEPPVDASSTQGHTDAIIADKDSVHISEPMEESKTQQEGDISHDSGVAMVNRAEDEKSLENNANTTDEHMNHTTDDANEGIDGHDGAYEHEEDQQMGIDHEDTAYAGEEVQEETDDDDVRYHEEHRDGDEHEDVEHNEDEYDPANPSHAGGEVDGYEPAEPLDSTSHADDEYDPANPAEGFANTEKKDDQVSSPTRKRKSSDTPTSASPAASGASTRSSKRSRNSTVPKVDKRGLQDSAWDRLMDFESTGEFRIAQVSRAAFSSIAKLPEFAQCSVVARFTRTPMKDVRDKNELILRIYHEYLGENPHVSSIQPVSIFSDITASDPGLFAFGYAPPLPSTGMSNVKIPFRQDKAGTISTPSVPSALPQKLPNLAQTKPQLDEFGREIKPKVSPSTPSKEQPKTTVSPAKYPSAPAGSSTGKPSDPRRRRTGAPDGGSAEPTRSAPSDKFRGQIDTSGVYNRLPGSVKSRLDDLIAARHLPEAINDNVLSRLYHLPEPTAVTAIEKFMESDLRQVGNINGFLVGIINRVQDRGPSPNDPLSVGSATRNAPHNAPSTSYQQQHPPQQSLSQHGPAMHRGYTGPSTAPLGHASSYEHPPGNHHTQTPMAVTAVPYDPRSTSQHPPGYASNAQHAYVGPTGRFSTHPTIDRAIAMLPVSVQNHLVSLVNSRIIPSLEDLSEKCYEVLGQLSEGLANDVLKRFGTANLATVRNRSAFLMGVVKKCRQEYGFN